MIESTKLEQKIAEIILVDNFDKKRFERIGEALIKRIARRESKKLEQQKNQDLKNDY